MPPAWPAARLRDDMQHATVECYIIDKPSSPPLACTAPALFFLLRSTNTHSLPCWCLHSYHSSHAPHSFDPWPGTGTRNQAFGETRIDSAPRTPRRRCHLYPDPKSSAERPAAKSSRCHILEALSCQVAPALAPSLGWPRHRPYR